MRAVANVGTCGSLSLILNEMLLIRENPSACPLGSHVRSRQPDHSIRFNTGPYDMLYCASSFRIKKASDQREGKCVRYNWKDLESLGD